MLNRKLINQIHIIYQLSWSGKHIVSAKIFYKLKTPWNKLCINKRKWTFSASATTEFYPANYPITEISYYKTPSSVPLISSITQNFNYCLPFIEYRSFVTTLSKHFFFVADRFLPFYKLKRAQKSFSALPNVTKRFNIESAQSSNSENGRVCFGYPFCQATKKKLCKNVCQKENSCHSCQGRFFGRSREFFKRKIFGCLK